MQLEADAREAMPYVGLTTSLLPDALFLILLCYLAPAENRKMHIRAWTTPPECLFVPHM